MPISSRVLQKAVNLGLTKGNQLAALKTQVIKAAPTPQQGRKDFTTVKRSVLNPSSAVSEDSFRKAFKVLDNAGAVKSGYHGSSGANLLKKASSAVKNEEKKQTEERKQEMLKRSLSARVRDEWNKNNKGGKITQRDVVDSILKEREKDDDAFNALQQAKSGESGQSSGTSNALTLGQKPATPPPENPAPPLDLQIG